eukprot:IDg18137t1
MATHFILPVALILAFASLTESAPGSPDFSDAVLNSFGNTLLATENAPGFPFGGSQPVAIYWELSYRRFGNAGIFIGSKGTSRPFQAFRGPLSASIGFRDSILRVRLGANMKEVKSSFKLKENTVYKIIINYDGNKLQLFIDGARQDSVTGVEAGTDSNPLKLGVDTFAGLSRTVSMKQVVLWRRALRLSEITA